MTRAGNQIGPFRSFARARISLLLAWVLLLGGGLATRAHGQLIRWGPFNLNLGVFAEAEFNDNVNSTEKNPKADVLLRVGPNINGQIILSPYLAGGQPLVLSLGLSFGMEWSLTGARHDNFTSPVNLSFALPVYIETWTVVLADVFSFNNDPLQSSLGYGGNGLNSYINTASANGSRQFGRFGLTLGVSREDDWYPSVPLEDVAIYTFTVTPSYAITQRYQLFIQNSYGIVEYDDPLRRDSKGWSSSVGVSGQLTRNVSGTASVGWSHSTLEAVHQPGNVHGPDNIDGLSSQVTLNMAKPLRPNTVYAISAYRSPGVSAVLRNSDITEVTGVTGTISHRLSRVLTLTPEVGFEYLRDLGTTQPGVKREVATVVRGGVGLDRAFSRKLLGYIRYTYQLRDSNLNGQGYQVNRVIVGLNYTF